eukprot:2106994-Heterocapsa_arctica.AAC.1
MSSLALVCEQARLSAPVCLIALPLVVRPVRACRRWGQLNCVRTGTGSTLGHGFTGAAVATGQRVAKGRVRGVPVARRVAAAASSS